MSNNNQTRRSNTSSIRNGIDIIAVGNTVYITNSRNRLRGITGIVISISRNRHFLYLITPDKVQYERAPGSLTNVHQPDQFWKDYKPRASNWCHHNEWQWWRGTSLSVSTAKTYRNRPGAGNNKYKQIEFKGKITKLKGKVFRCYRETTNVT